MNVATDDILVRLTVREFTRFKDKVRFVHENSVHIFAMFFFIFRYEQRLRTRKKVQTKNGARFFTQRL